MEQISKLGIQMNKNIKCTDTNNEKFERELDYKSKLKDGQFIKKKEKIMKYTNKWQMQINEE